MIIASMRILLLIIMVMGVGGGQLAAAAEAEEAMKNSQSAPRFFDSDDGWFDASEFLDTAYGFVPVIAPITEPAIGYGAAGALVFIDRHPLGQNQEFVRPNIAMAGGLATENGTEGLFAGHLGTWMNGRLRTTAAVADMDVNLEFFGLGGQHNPGDGLDYTIAAQGGVIGGNYKFGEKPLWFGLRFLQATPRVSFDVPAADLPEFLPGDGELRLTALTPSLTLDMRNNFFTPTQGWYVDLSVPIFRKGLGGDRDFETASLLGMHYRPLAESLFFAARGGVKTSSDGTPFYLRPFVWLRGVQALGYQGEDVAEFEAELRWQWHSRFSLVGFGGAGIVRSDLFADDKDKTVTAGGAGFRYLIARKHGLHMGMDVAFGPDDPVLYVIFGNAWMRP
jgi:hypothetical protein